MTKINKKTLEYLAGLGKIELKAKDEEKLLKDLGNILAYFEELKELNTEEIEPLAGGTIGENIFRDDESRKDDELKKERELAKRAFPEKGGGFLKVPAVFEE